ncbi:hypothetical protein ACM26M_01865 [Kluyvera cryocrescens]
MMIFTDERTPSCVFTLADYTVYIISAFTWVIELRDGIPGKPYDA